MNWKYHTDPAAYEESHCGFVYLITCNKRKYIGRKNFKRKRTRPPLKGYKRKRVVYVDSGWRDYTGSSGELQSDIAKYGCKREILHICKTYPDLKYMENYEIYTRHALIRDDYYNKECHGHFNTNQFSQDLISQWKK